jgi:hypothetical protein
VHEIEALIGEDPVVLPVVVVDASCQMSPAASLNRKSVERMSFRSQMRARKSTSSSRPLQSIFSKTITSKMSRRVISEMVCAARGSRGTTYIVALLVHLSEERSGLWLSDRGCCWICRPGGSQPTARPAWREIRTIGSIIPSVAIDASPLATQGSSRFVRSSIGATRSVGREAAAPPEQ